MDSIRSPRFFRTLIALGVFGTAYGQGFYVADFSVDGQGSTHDSSGSDPIEASPIMGENWQIRWDVEPGSDTSTNSFITEGGKLISSDWGGRAIFETNVIDVSGANTVSISTVAETVGTDVFNNPNAPEQFIWFYILDGGARVSKAPIMADGSLNYEEAVDVSGANSLVVGFEFEVNGGGDGFEITTVRVDDEALDALSLSIPDVILSETELDGGTTSLMATVSRPDASADQLVVSLASGDEGELSVPASVTIPADSASVEFEVTAVDDDELDGEQSVTITASADGFIPATGSIVVEDDEKPLPRIFLNADPASFSENGGSSVITVDSTENPDGGNYTFNIVVSDETEASAPATFDITGANGSGTFTVTAVDDNDSDGVQNVKVTLTEANGAFQPAEIDLMVTDDEVFAFPAVVINELRMDQAGGDDDEYFELFSPRSGASLERISLIVLGDGQGGSGVIESVVDLGEQSMNGNYLLVGEGSFTLQGATPDFVAELNFENRDNVTYLLVTDFSGSNQDDLDTDDDGTLDVTPWGSILDGVGILHTEDPPVVTDGVEFEYATSLSLPVVGPADGTNGEKFRPDHLYLNSEGAWLFDIGTFDNDTPGVVNPDGEPPVGSGVMIVSFVADRNEGRGDLTVSGLGTKLYDLQVSTDLDQSDPWRMWTEGFTETDNPDGSTTLTFFDALISNEPKLFFRLIER